MVAEPGPDMRIRAMTSGSSVLVDAGGRRGLGRGVRLGGAVGGAPEPGRRAQQWTAGHARHRRHGAALRLPRATRLLPQRNDYFEADWQTAFWGDHYARLLQVKERYDPDGLFFVHHGVGTDI
jgi:FAD/FMN-containing dehydrogenase